jgi:hypothetical protein
LLAGGASARGMAGTNGDEFRASRVPKEWKDTTEWPQRNATLSVGSLLRSSYLLYFSKPAGDRALYQAISKQSVRSLVELGLDLSGRTERILEVVSWKGAHEPIRYTGIDLFDARPLPAPRLPLKQAFTALRKPHSGLTLNVQLVPGDPASALARVANSLARTDLLVIHASQDQESLARAWAWIPRMLTSSSLVLVEGPAQTSGPSSWRKLTLPEVHQLAAQAGANKRRAA